MVKKIELMPRGDRPTDIAELYGYQPPQCEAKTSMGCPGTPSEVEIGKKVLTACYYHGKVADRVCKPSTDVSIGDKTYHPNGQVSPVRK